MKDVAQIKEQIKLLSKARCLTNCLLIGKQLEALIASEDVEVFVSPRLVVLVQATEHSTKLWFFAQELADFADISKAITPAHARPITLELVGKWQPVAALVEAFSADFTHRVTFSRWSVKRGDVVLSKAPQDANVAFAQMQHLPEIQALLLQTFDPLIYTLPTAQALADYIEKEQIYAYFEEGALLGFTIAYPLNKRFVHTDYSVVKPQARGKGVYNTVYAHILSALTPEITVVQYADVKNPVTGRKDGVFGLTQDDFAKAILIYKQ